MFWKIAPVRRPRSAVYNTANYCNCKEAIMNGILGSAVLDVAIGLVFVYLLLALLTTTLNEWILSYVLNLRAKTLGATLQTLLSGQPLPGSTFVDEFMKHPMISKMSTSGGIGMCYLPSRSFAMAVLDLVTKPGPGILTFQDVKTGIEKLPDGHVRQTLCSLMMHCKEDLDAFQAEIEHWFDSAMDAASGIVKRHAQAWAAVLAIVITLITNADTFALSRTLWLSSAVRAQVVQQAQARTDAQTPVTQSEMQLLGQVLGWEKAPTEYSAAELARRIPGWLLTVVAVSLGAPFWFDVLSRFMSVRNAGKPPAPKPTEPAPGTR